jgi:glycosyltransferase involved in cell wall biosynthesis
MDPLVTVVIPVFNGERFIAQALDSVLRQTFTDWELVIVDDGSTDATAQRIEPYLQLPSIRYIRQKNRGSGSARNRALSVAKGRYVALLDHDDLWLPDKLLMQMDLLATQPDVKLVHGNIRFIDGEGVEFIPAALYVTDAAGRCFDTLFLGNSIAVSTVLLDRVCLEGVGGFDEGLLYAEDYHLWMRMAKRYQVGHVDEYLALYRKHENNLSLNIIPHHISVLKALEMILREFADARDLIGPAAVQGRLHWLTHHISTLYYRSRKPVRGAWWASKAKRLAAKI